LVLLHQKNQQGKSAEHVEEKVTAEPSSRQAVFATVVICAARQGEICMKTVFTTSGNDLSAPLDRRFGRAPKYLVYDMDANSFELVDNRQNLNAAQGAGIQSAENVARTGAKALVTGHCGPKAFKVLAAAGIKIFNCDAPTVAEAMAQFRAGELTEAQAADVEGHWA
jgi:predicted Fe-Mo cluster-binding NifX family protein